MSTEKKRKAGDLSTLRDRLYTIVFESDTAAGKAFDIALIAIILLSVLVVLIESVSYYRTQYGNVLRSAEWVFTILFTIEYLVRLWASRRPLVYARSFFGAIDLLAVIPTYLSVIIPGAQYLLVIRVLRILRIFRILKLSEYLMQANILMDALRTSREKITVFVATVLMLVVILGSLMYLVEGEANGFTSIPRSIYWAVVTLTTVGYGDISPQTNIGQTLSIVVMIIGYGIIAVPTGIVTVELTRAENRRRSERSCPGCSATGHDRDAVYCKFCGEDLEKPRPVLDEEGRTARNA